MAKTSTRRTVVTLSAVGAVVWGVSAAIRWSNAPGMTFEDIPDVPGFRRLDGGEVTRVAFDPLIGLENRPVPPPIPDDALCATLFANTRPGTVPVAAFTDYFCPLCRGQNALLWEREAAGEITLTWHELPLLSDQSEPAARVALAADLQGAYRDIHERMTRARFAPTDAYITSLAEGAGLDADRLRADLSADIVTERIETARGLGARFRFAGTPALVMGRTAVFGLLDETRFDDLLQLEADAASHCLA